MSLYHDAKSGCWYVSISVPGRARIRRSTGTADKAEAQRLHDRWRADAWENRPAAGKTWQDAAAAWLNAGERGKSDRYLIRNYTDALGNPSLAELTTEHLTHAMGRKSPGTWNRYRNILLAILHHAEAMGWIAAAPTIPSRKAPAGRTRWLTRDEWSRLEAQLPDHLLAPARFAVATGIRRANLLGLEWSQIDLSRRVMWIHPDQAKAARAIGIPLSDTAV